jgi:hypothetical protein
MAIVNGTDFEFIDLQSNSGGNTTRHMIRDAQARQDLISAIYQELNATQTKPESGNAIITQEFRILKNQAYLLTIETIGTATITTRLTNLGETVERLYAGPAVTDMVIIPAYDANYFRVVGSNDFTVSFKTLNAKTVYDLALDNEQGIELINGKIPLYTTNYAGLINGTAVVSDLDSIAENISYRMNYAVGSTSIPAHTPYGSAWGSATLAYFQSIVKTPGTHSAGDLQLFIGSDAVHVRSYTASWTAWTKVYGIDAYAKNNSALITTTATVSDLNDISSNISYRLNYALNSTSIPANTPYGNAWKSESVAYIQSMVKTPGTHSAGDFQLFVGSDGIYTRNYTVSWTAWRKLYEGGNGAGREYVVDINGTGDYTSLCACIDAAVAYANSVIYVKRGTYDAIAEMLALKGNNYFDDFATSTDQIYVRNGLKIICEPGTVLTAHYTGTNAIVKSYYAPINFRNSDGYIEGLEIDASNCRYCIHDDQWTYTEPYKHTLKNCRLIIDNSENTDWDRRLAFGGGLGVNGYIVFDGCYFKSVGLDGTAYSGYGSAGYHNSPSADAQSAIYVTNCYFADNSTFRLTRHGSSTKMTRAFVSGCSLGREMELTYEQTSSTPHNCEIVDCNNVIRT